MIKKLLSICLFICILFAQPAFAKDTYGGYTVPVDITINGDFIQCEQKPFLENGVTYIPLRAFCNAVGATISWDSETSVATVSASGHTFCFSSQWSESLIDGVPSLKAIEENHLLFVPIKPLCDALGYAVEWDGFYYVVCITAPNITVPDTSKDFRYTYNDMLYLGKITYVECGAEPFQTQIGIANTVVNRVRSPLYPNTIAEAIYDTKHGVQYPPAHTDKMNVTPSITSMLAAKCALNGVELVGDCVAFVHISALESSWAANHMQHYTTLGQVAFFRFD